MRSRTTLAVLLAAAVIGARLGATADAQTLAPAPASIQLSSTGSPQDFSTAATDPVLTPDAVSQRVLAVWQVSTTADTRAAVARVLDGTGHPLGPQFVLPGFAATASPVAVAARPHAGGWIVVAAVSARARATRVVSLAVSRDGTPGARHFVSSSAPFVSAAVVDPRIALDPRTGRGVIVWFLDRLTASVKHRGGVYARAVDTLGRPETPARAVYAVPQATSIVTGRLTLGFVAKTRRWLAVWQSSRSVFAKGAAARSENRLSSRVVLRNARPRGPVHALTRAMSFGEQLVGRPTVVTDTGGTDALLLYTGDEPPARNGVRLLRLGPGGGALGRHPKQIGSATDEPLASTHPIAVRDPLYGGFVLVYTDVCDPLGHEQCPEFVAVHGQRLGGVGAPIGGSGVLVSQAVGPAALARMASGTYLLAWPAAVAFGTPFDDAAAMGTRYPLKSEIVVRALKL